MAVPARLLRSPAGNRAAAPAPLQVVSPRPRTRSGARKIWPAVAVAVCSLMLIFGVLIEQVVLAQSAFRLSEVRKELAESRALHEELLLESATLESPGRIESFARKKLGMVDPDPSTTQYVVADIEVRDGAEEGLGSSDGPSAAEGESVALEGAP